MSTYATCPMRKQVVGEYVAKIYLESKRRPRFIVERMI